MAVYKVPQDVEADDKLLGPFSFRQFIYLIVVALGLFLGWALGNLFLPLAIIPLPVVLFFGALALPLRKDQPMEVYLAAVVSFYIKPRRRLWQPDGLTSLVRVTAPKVVEVQRTKSLTQEEAERRLSYLADIVDTGGWAVRGAGVAPVTPGVSSDIYYEAQQTEDIMDEAATITQNFDMMIEKNDQKRRQEIMDLMKEPASPPTTQQPQATQPAQQPIQDPIQPSSHTDEPTNLNFDPYPASIRQSVIRPLSEQQSNQPAPGASQPQAAAQTTPQPRQQPEPAQPQPKNTSEMTVSPDTIRLANQHDLSIETIANEANRLKQKEQEGDEVVISLR